MAAILIDTQVLVWLLNDDDKLGPMSLSRLSNAKNRIFVSYFSLFEIAIKASIGKMTYDATVVEDFQSMGIELVGPNIENLQRYRIFNPTNKDPFDNILVAVALTEKCELMTSDAKLLDVSVKGLKLSNASA